METFFCVQDGPNITYIYIHRVTNIDHIVCACMCVHACVYMSMYVCAFVYMCVPGEKERERAAYVPISVSREGSGSSNVRFYFNYIDVTSVSF